MARILLVEDEEAVCRTIATFLTKHGHDVLAFSDGEPALEALQGEDVDVILTDLLMPFPGQEVVRLARLRGFEGRIVIMSGALKLDTAYCEVLSADKALRKPFALGDLVQLIDNLLE